MTAAYDTGSNDVYTESPVSSQFKPLKHVVYGENNIPLLLKYPYANNLCLFENEEINRSLGINKDDHDETYRTVYNWYDPLVPEDIRAVDTEFSKITYSERVFPSGKNAYRTEIRGRDSFHFPWRESHLNRLIFSSSNMFEETFGAVSMWPLDGPINTSSAGFILSGSDNGFSGWDMENGYGFGLLGLPYSTYCLKDSVTYSEDIERKCLVPVYDRPLLFPKLENGVYQLTMSNYGVWDAPAQSGKSPFRVDYGKFSEYIRAAGKEYGLVPEFRISEHIPFYVDEKGGDWLAENSASFNIPGHRNSLTSSFYQTFSHSDFLKFFDVIKDDHKTISEPDKIKLKCSAFLKFLPYDGFYPAQRTVEIASLFSESVMKDCLGMVQSRNMSTLPHYANKQGSILSTASNIPAEVKNFLYSKLFSPGILYNSIKAGISIPFPQFSWLTLVGVDGLIGRSSINNTYVNITGSDVDGKFDGGFVRWSGSCDNNVSRLYTDLIPFESILDYSLLAEKSYVEHNPEPEVCGFTGSSLSWTGEASSTKYELAIHNFFAETVDFFLQDSKMTTILSQPRLTSDVNYSATYYTLFSMKNGPKSSLFKPDLLDVGAHNCQPTPWPQSDNLDMPFVPKNSNEFVMYNNEFSFGPPLELNSSSDPKTSWGPLSTAASSTPPYFDGEGACLLSFTPDPSKEYTYVTDILGDLSQSFFRSGYFAQTIKGLSLDPEVVSVGAHSGNQILMDDCFNMMEKVKMNSVEYEALSGKPMNVKSSPNDVYEVLSIQPKWETPILYFGDSTSSFTIGDQDYITGSAANPIGMWHQYGRIPKNLEESIYIQFSGDIYASFFDYIQALGYTDGMSIEDLADLLGFDKASRQMGKLAEYKEVFEALVAVPYYIENGETKFFNIDRTQISEAKDVVSGLTRIVDNTGKAYSNSVIDMVRKMKKYVIPPRMNFIDFEDIDPFAMYIFEFSMKLSKQDLADIWQNLYPDVHTAFQHAEQSISHPFLKQELLGESAKDKIRWMIFKVKQKAKQNYYDKTISNADDDRFRFDFKMGRRDSARGIIPDYSYNWPYDYFSIIELAKLDAEVTIGREEEPAQVLQRIKEQKIERREIERKQARYIKSNPPPEETYDEAGEVEEEVPIEPDPPTPPVEKDPPKVKPPRKRPPRIVGGRDHLAPPVEGPPKAPPIMIDPMPPLTPPKPPRIPGDDGDTVGIKPTDDQLRDKHKEFLEDNNVGAKSEAELLQQTGVKKIIPGVTPGTSTTPAGTSVADGAVGSAFAGGSTVSDLIDKADNKLQDNSTKKVGK